MGYSLIPSELATFETLVPSAAIAASATVTVHTETGDGLAMIVQKSDGSSQVDMVYSIDGGADVPIAKGNQRAITPVSFSTSLDIKAINTSATPRTIPSVSVTGAT